MYLYNSIRNKRRKKIKLIKILIFIVILFFIIKIFPMLILTRLDESIIAKFSKKEVKEYNLIDLIRYVNIAITKNIKYTPTSNVDYVIDDEVYKIKVELKEKNPNSTYSIAYGIKGDLKEEPFSGSKEITFSFNKDGKYICQIEVKQDGKTIEDEKWERIIYYIKSYKKQFLEELEKKGVVDHVDTTTFSKFQPLYNSLGAQLVRTEMKLNWIYENGQFNFSNHYNIVNQMLNNNIKLLVILGSSGNTLGEDKIVSSEEDLQLYEKYVQTLVQKYPRIVDFEIWNEPNSVYINDEQIEWYAKTIQETYKTIKSLNDRARILTISGSYSGNVIEPTEFISKLSKKDVYKFSDLFSFHPYDFAYNTSLNKVYKENLEKEIDYANKLGGFTSIATTEFGGSTYSEKIPGALNEQQQAIKIVQQFVIGDINNVKYQLVYNFRDTGTNKENKEENYGIVNNGYTPKQSYYSMKNYFQNTNGAECVGEIDFHDGLESYLYNKDGKPKIITWAKNKEIKITMKYENFTATDLYGNEIKADNDGNITIIDSPVYIDNISNEYFFNAIKTIINTKYEKLKKLYIADIEKIDGLLQDINNMQQLINDISPYTTQENSIQLMKQHYKLGTKILQAHKEEKIKLDYQYMSSILDSLDDIGNSFEDLVTISSKTKKIDENDLELNINNAKNIISNNEGYEMTYSNKIYNFAQEYYETSTYINNLKEDNPIKIGLINSKAIHSSELAKWSYIFSEIYIKDNILITPKEIVNKLEEIESNYTEIFNNINVSYNYNLLKLNLQYLINNENLVGPQSIEDCYKLQYQLIEVILREYNNESIQTNVETLIAQIDELSNLYIKVLSNYKLNNIISDNEVKENLNKTIDRYNNLDINVSEILFLIQMTKNIYNNELTTVNEYRNYLNKQRIIYMSDICTKYMDEAVVIVKDELEKISVEYNKDLTVKTNGPITATLIHGNHTKIINNDGKESYDFIKNEEFNFLVKIKQNTYNVTASVNNIQEIKIEKGYIKYIKKNTIANSLNYFISNIISILHNGQSLNLSEGIVSTGDILKASDNKVYTLVVTGDINGDGDITARDLLNMRKYLVGANTFNELKLLAADTNIDGKVNAKDLISIRKILLE